jgi:hypothetical protein
MILGVPRQQSLFLAACQLVPVLYYREMSEHLKWYDDKADNSPWIDALADLRQRATREGYCYQHVQAITVAIDQYAEKALGNRDYFLNKPYGVG